MSSKKKKRMIALDADFLIFEVTEGRTTQGSYFSAEDGSTRAKGYKEPLKPYKQKLKQLIKDIEDEVAVQLPGEVKGIKPFFSDPDTNFRYKIYPEYKGNRKGSERSKLFYRLRKWAHKKYGYGSPDSHEKTYTTYIYKPSKEKLGVWVNNKPLYDLYDNMCKRCYRVDYKSNHYKTLGVKVFTPWLDSKNEFFKWAMSNGYKNGLTIDRIDNNSHYTPSNCQFITDKDNKIKQHLCDNRRDYVPYNLKYRAHMLKKDGKSMSEICELLSIPYGTGRNSKKSKLQQRLEKSFSSDKTLYKYEREEDWIASKLSDGVIFILNNVEYISVDGVAKLSFKRSGWEADDQVSYYVRNKGWIGATFDKDMLRGVPGTWFDVYHSRRHLVHTSEGEARNFNLLQTLMGDPVDNIKGIPGVGEKTAIKLLDKYGWTWDGVLKAYESKGLGLDEMQLNARLVLLDQWHPKKGLKLWGK